MKPFRLRLLALILGGAMLFWLPVEDTSIVGVFIFAASICFLTAAFVIEKHAQNSWHYPIVGFLAGLAVSPTAFLLAAFKTGLHGHGYPDYTPAQVQSILSRAPGWALAGLLISLGAYLLVILRRSEE